MSSWLARQILNILGWQMIGRLPEPRKCVVLAVPHTSNWDFFYLYLLSKIIGVRIYWMGKAELFKGVLGPITRALGGIPVKRDRTNNLVSQMAQAFGERDELVLAIPPAGTRRKSDYWKSGFYYIATEAQVPITMGFLDYKRKQVGFGPSFHPTGDMKADMNKIRTFYADKTGKFPEGKSVIRLKQEDAPEPPAGGPPS